MRKHAADVGIGVALVAIAMAVRWPHLMLVPAFGDESLEVQRGLEIAQGGHLSLTGHDAYYGPIFPYLIAAAFTLFGTRLLVPRAVIAVFGALTVPLTFWFGRVAGGRGAGLLAASVVLTCPALVLYSSHYAWSNSLTPFFATLACFGLYAAVERRATRLLAGSGLLVALAVQTHPLTAVPFAGAFVWLVVSRRREPWLTRAELGKALLCFGLGYSPVILENVIHPFITARVAFMRTYAFAPTLSPTRYLARLVDLVRTMCDMLSGGLAFDRVPAPTAGTVLAGVVIGVALVFDWRRGNRLILYIVLSTLLVWPAFVTLYIPRYVSFLIPIVCVAIAAAIRRVIRERSGASSVVSSRMAVSVIVIAALAGVQLVAFESTTRYRTAAVKAGLTNEIYDRLLDVVRDRAACGDKFLVEDIGFPYADSAWVGLDAADYALALSGCDHRQLTTAKLRAAMSAEGDGWALLSSATAGAWAAEWHLTPVFVLPAPTGPDLVPLTLYRATRR